MTATAPRPLHDGPVAPRPDPLLDLSRLERELDALAREDAALVEQARAIVEQRTDVARRIEEVRTAGAVVRRVLGA